MHLEKSPVWGIKSMGQMAQIARIATLMDLRHLTLTLASGSYVQSKSNGHWGVLPELQGRVSKLVSIELEGFNLKINQKQLIGGFINPSTLRRLELLGCFGDAELLGELSKHPEIHNLEELTLEDGYNGLKEGEISSQQIIDFINTCTNLNMLNLRIAPFPPNCIQLLIQAIAKSGKSLQTLSVDLVDFDENQIH